MRRVRRGVRSFSDSERQARIHIEEWQDRDEGLCRVAHVKILCCTIDYMFK